VAEKLKRRTIRLRRADTDPARVAAAAELIRDIRGVTQVRIERMGRIAVQYNVRQITLQIIEALLVEFDYEVDTSLMCRMMRATRPHGCRDPRPEYQKRYL
jgi:hypothetical protein